MERMRERLNRIGRSYARTGGAEVGDKPAMEVGDQADIYRTPQAKDLTGWRGPAEIERPTQGEG